MDKNVGFFKETKLSST